MQFAHLLARALQALGRPALAYVGEVTYLHPHGDFALEHAWVALPGDVVVDGNADSLVENPMVPGHIAPRPYWGPRAAAPDRVFQHGRILHLPPADDEDMQIWWPELKAFVANVSATARDK